MSWIRITEIANIPPREGRAVSLGRREIAVFNLGDRFAAIENRCPHNGGPLCDSILSGDLAVCPLHGWKINLNTGQVQHPQVGVCVETFPTRVEAGVVLLQVNEEAREEAA